MSVNCRKPSRAKAVARAWSTCGNAAIRVIPRIPPDLAKVPTEIPFNRIDVAGKEMEYMAEAIRNGHCSGDGPFTKKCQELLERELSVKSALLTTSCTGALEMAAILLNIQPGDEVIVPSFTFVSSISAFVLRGARPVFADIRPDTLNIDESRLGALITPRTRAIVVVHYAGVACEMDSILEVAGRHGITVVEDNAHGLFGTYKGRPLGSFGALATLSFHETKNYSCGEGGAILINDPQYLSRAEILREKGTDRTRFFRGEVDKYTWVDIGSSYALSDMSAGFLFGQLEKFREIRLNRERIWNNYRQQLQEWAYENGVGLPHIPRHCGQAFHLFYLIMPSLATREAFIAHLRASGIKSAFHYLPLHTSPMGLQMGGERGSCPVSEDVSDRLVRLPFFNSVSELDQARVILASTKFHTFPRQAHSRGGSVVRNQS